MRNPDSKYNKESARKQRQIYKKNSYYGPTSRKYEKRAWEDNEERLVMFSQKPDRELSRILHRSVGSIQRHRCLVNKQGRPWLKNKEPITKATPKKEER